MYAITYSPLGDEPDPTIATAKDTEIIYTISPTYKIEPSQIAEEIKKITNGKNLRIYIPGRIFDKHGMRRGRGKGWYDRLLPLLPQTWERIGVCFEHQFSETPLAREAWDQLMDQVCVVKKDTVCWHETKARTLI